MQPGKSAVEPAPPGGGASAAGWRGGPRLGAGGATGGWGWPPYSVPRRGAPCLAFEPAQVGDLGHDDQRQQFIGHVAHVQGTLGSGEDAVIEVHDGSFRWDGLFAGVAVPSSQRSPKEDKHQQLGIHEGQGSGSGDGQGSCGVEPHAQHQHREQCGNNARRQAASFALRRAFCAGLAAVPPASAFTRSITARSTVVMGTCS